MSTSVSELSSVSKNLGTLSSALQITAPAHAKEY